MTGDRHASVLASRVVIVAAAAASLGSYLWTPASALAWTVDILVRTYLHFVLGAMAHDAAHGHLGRSRAANLWWGRLALLPTSVAYVSFRHTHLAHHRHTNERDADPDEFLNAPAWQLPFRMVAMPHHWVLWLRRNGRLTPLVLREYVATYAAYLVVFGALAWQAGAWRVLAGLLGAAVLHSFLLWYPFAIKTHEGYSTADDEARSHEYLGHVAYFFSFGLSLHRAHHLKPQLGWLQLLPYVQRCTWWEALTFRRDVHDAPR